jgi:hypothetical protein
MLMADCSEYSLAWQMVHAKEYYRKAAEGESRTRVRKGHRARMREVNKADAVPGTPETI